jgi:hypothetical protein
VKWRLFRHLLHGGDEDAVRVYRWHIEKRSGLRIKAGLPTDGWKRSLDDYLQSASALAGCMRRQGFFRGGAIPVDPDGELLGGAHRLACALALGIAEVPVTRDQRRVWAPAWGEAWFRDNEMAVEDIVRLRRDWLALYSGQH